MMLEYLRVVELGGYIVGLSKSGIVVEWRNLVVMLEDGQFVQGC